jgi:TrmH family RNA methyltransferase
MKTNHSEQIAPISKAYCHELKKLHQKKFRRLENKTLVEGLNLIEQLHSNGVFPIEIVCKGTEALPKFVNEADTMIWTAKEPEYQYLSDTDNPQPIMAVFNIPLFEIKTYRAILFLDGIQDPGNLGTIFRIAAAFNFDGIVLSSGCCEVFSPKVIRASLGSVFWVPSIVVDESWLAKQKAIKIGMDSHSKSSIEDINLKQNEPIILVIGSESSGIAESLKPELTHTVSITISNKMESINAAVATGIAAYIVSKQLFLLT